MEPVQSRQSPLVSKGWHKVGLLIGTAALVVSMHMVHGRIFRRNSDAWKAKTPSCEGPMKKEYCIASLAPPGAFYTQKERGPVFRVQEGESFESGGTRYAVLGHKISETKGYLIVRNEGSGWVETIPSSGDSESAISRKLRFKGWTCMKPDKAPGASEAKQ